MAVFHGGCGGYPPPVQPPPVQPPSRPAGSAHAEPLLALLEREPEAARQFRLGGRGPAFTPTITQETYQDLPEGVRLCSEAILAAQLAAMRATANDAAKSFRNCADEESRDYLHAELKAFRASVDHGRPDEATRHLGAAMAALHGFYAHTNFVELLADELTDWPAASGRSFAIWKPGPLPVVDVGRLVSDHRESAFPKKCKPPPPRLDKGSKNQPEGKLEIKQWGLTAHEAAVALALADGGSLLKDIWKSYPSYAQACGGTKGSESAVVGFLHALGDLLGLN